MSKQHTMPGRKTPAPEITDSDKAVLGEGKPLQNVKVVSLEIDENDDYGTDPYNRTGSFCVPDFEQE